MSEEEEEDETWVDTDEGELVELIEEALVVLAIELEEAGEVDCVELVVEVVDVPPEERIAYAPPTTIITTMMTAIATTRDDTPTRSTFNSGTGLLYIIYVLLMINESRHKFVYVSGSIEGGLA